MYALSFLFAVGVFLVLSVFVYLSYPRAWRENRLFRAGALLWHGAGALSLACVFTVIRLIPQEGIRNEIVRVATYYYVMIVLLAACFFLRLLVSRTYGFIRRQTGRAGPGRVGRFLSDDRLHSILFAVLAYAVCTAGYFRIDLLQTTEYDVDIPKASATEALTAVLIADIHAGSGNWSFVYDDLAARIDAAEPDVLLIAGDIFDETTSDRDVAYVARTLSSIRRPRLGIYVIYGNHDDHREDWMGETLRAMGATVLEDAMTVLDGDIQLLCRTDPKHGALDFETLWERAAPDPNKPLLVLTHRPEDFREMAEKGCDLAMAGHTHGFNIPQFLGAPLFGDMYSGRRSYGNMTAITTSGVSAWGFHYKWPAVSEVVTIRLRFTGAPAG